MSGIFITPNEDGVFEEYEPYSTICVDTKEDYEILEKLLKQGKKMQWIPVEERLPECDYDTVLCVTDTNFWAVMVYTKEHGFRSGDIYFSGEVIAWMPLPEPFGKE